MDPIRVENLSDDILYQQFLRGDTDAYDALLVRYGDRLIVYLYGYLHDWPEAEDQMIEAFARIMAKRPRIREGAFRAYLYRTARNLALRIQERKHRLQMFSIDGTEPEIAESILAAGKGGVAPGTAADENAAAGKSPVEEDLEREERKALLYECLDRIEPDLREALWLIYIEDMSYAQAADVMGVKTKRIDRLLVRGKQRMRIELKKEGMRNAYE